MLPQNNNIPTMIGLNSKADTAIAKALQEAKIEKAIYELAEAFLIKLWFSRPVEIIVNGHLKNVDCHLFRDFFLCGDQLCYTKKRNGRTGYYMPGLDAITRLEIIHQDHQQEFQSYEQFKKKFDPRFITETEIKNLWNSKSSQHGGKYNRSDFHAIGPRGKEVVKRFLAHFKNVNEPTGYYHIGNYENSDYQILTERHQSWHHSGRDISISHQTNIPFIHYSSEYHNCGNGRYGLLANEHEFLWLEDD